MLDFLGLNYEAELVVQFMALGGLLAGLGFGFLASGAKGWLDKLLTVLAWVFLGLAVVSAGLACVAGFVLLITFKWGKLCLAMVIGGVLAYVLYLIPVAVLSGIRRGKYKKNPLMKEIVEYCKRNDIVGIQCFPDRVRFFSELENAEYCQSEEKVVHEESQRNGIATEGTDLRPAAWKSYDNPPSLTKALRFVDRDYPNLPDVVIFAEALASSLGGCGVAHHSTAVRYKYYRFNGSTGQKELVNHTTHTYEDYFVYKKSALKKLKNTKKQRDREAQARQAAANKNANRWE